ncbi:MAG: hypothetical protein Q7U04_16170 [Bacteriovorax sp.]|nr:hypothetical protein [Bacteriovorax sp.]
MKLLTLILSLMIYNLSFAAEHEGGIHTPNYCSIKNTQSCAHLKFDTFPTSSEESKFVLHIFSANGKEIQNLKAKLWMDMGDGEGHSSAPVEITSMDELNHFYIQNAWFVMKGAWQVQVSFIDGAIEQNINIPLDILK